jgi:sulfur relay (sulfurtransferase) DsrF/TusC family protein
LNKTLVIFSQGALSGQNVLEALSATLVMATYGMPLTVCFQGDAVSLLIPPKTTTNQITDYFKSAFAMVESFEYYDVLPVWVETQSATLINALEKSPIPHETIKLDSSLLNQFSQVIYW